MTPAALGLSAKDFDAYLPERASSNAFSRPRLEFKQRAMAWARGVGSRLADLGIPVDIHGSDEHPSLWNHHCVDSQWVFFWRDAAARADIDALLDLRRGIADTVRDPSPFFRHAFLALRFDASGLEICVQVHPDAWLDFETLFARLAVPERAAAIASTLARLPDQFGFGVGRDPSSPCGTASVEALAAAAAEARRRSDTLWIGWRIPRDVAIEHSALLDDQLEDAIVALAPVYRDVAWSADDDPAHAREQLEKVRADTQRSAAERAAQDQLRSAQTEAERIRATEQSRERTREKVDYAARPAISLANLFKSDSAPATPVPPAVRAPAPKPAKPQHPARSAQTPRPPSDHDDAREPAQRRQHHDKPAPQRTQHHHDVHVDAPRALHDVDLVDDPNGVLDKGSQVRVNAGPFAGKVGVVGELDGRGGARVLLGLLSTRLAVADLSVLVEAKDRPPLHSSHRRPPIRSGQG